jgi:hypothetical protein
VKGNIVSESELTPVRQALLDFSRGQADRYQAVRALIDHDDWLAPTLVLQRYYQHVREDDLYPGRKALYVLGEQTILPPGKLLLFTDFPAATKAQHAGIPMGPYTGGVSGLALFSDIFSGWEELFINAGSPEAETWFQQPDGSGGYESFQRFARQVGFERKLAAAAEKEALEELVELIRTAAEPFGALMLRSGQLLSGITGDGSGLMLFTAPDCVEAARQALASAGTMEGASLVQIRGTIVNKIPGGGVIGVMVNAFGPGPKAEVWWK